MCAAKYGFKPKDPSKIEVKVIKQDITIAQIQRGPQDLNSYRTAIQSAESARNPNRSKYYELGENVMTDGILQSVIDKRIRAVTISPLTMEGTEDEELIKLFQQPWMIKLLKYMLQSKIWGHSLLEVEMDERALKEPDLYQLFKINLIPRRNVSPEWGVISDNPNNPNTGIPFRDPPYVNYLLEFGEPKDLGLLINLIPYVIYKRNNFSDYAQFNEVFGMPQRIYEYDPNQPETRKQVEEQARSQGAAPYVIVPKGVTVTQNQTFSAAGQGGFDRFHEILNKEMTISVLGQTLTTGADGKGSYALGEIHQDVEQAINLEDKIWVEYQLNWTVKPLLIQTFGLDKLKGVTWKFDDTIKLTPKEKTEIFTMLLEKGVPMKLDYIYEELNMPIPDEADMELWKKLKAAMGQVMQPSNEEQPTSPSGDPAPDPPKKSLALMLDEYGYDAAHYAQRVTLSYSDDIRAEVERIIAAIHAGTLSRTDVPADLVKLVFQQLDLAVSTGYGTLTRASDPELLSALRRNAFSFSAAKEFNFIRDAFDRLVDENDVIKPFGQFRDEVLALHEQYNVNWLQTEYNAAVGNSQMASKWADLTANNDPTDLLKFRAVNDDRSRHKKYNGIVLPINHEAWNWMMPLLDWGCRCTVNVVRRGEPTPADQIPTKDGIKPAFQFNPGKQRMVFSKTHPYWTSLSQGQRENSRDDWGLKMPE